ncbi:LOW QUALITY PROTEIN: kinase suppressor of Ras 1 [Oncorhynchus keta]|uniref:LOW QUALITY PROTEIN: kinase suppressor of Ras 1 n=1 Tax=Oncorhynchus keta TaxID=8018 RepID=UPI00227CECA9|nr:LOW QUALITY PROTEIN: kinase suppressor of Ras 1 [Oncorhynchus keta]
MLKCIYPLKPCQCRGMDSVSDKGGKMVESDEQSERDSGGGAAMAALHQCELIQNMIEISISSLQGLRTKCAASNDLTQQEIRTLEVKLMKYICKQLQCKQKVPETERPQALDSYPRLGDWLRTINLRPELIEAVPLKLSLDALLQMPGSQVQETVRRLGSTSEECARLTAALSCLKSATESDGELREDGGLWFSEPTRRDSGSLLLPADQLMGGMGGPMRPHSPSPLARPPTTPSTPPTPCTACAQTRFGSVSAMPGPEAHGAYIYADSPFTDPFPLSAAHQGRLYGHTSTPPITPPSKRRHRLKPPCTPPPPSRKVMHLLPNITLTRSKSHESQLGNRIEEPPTNKCAKQNKLFLNVQINGNGCEDSPSRSPHLSARTPGASTPAPATAPYTLPGTPTLMEEHSSHLKNNMGLRRGSPQAVRRDIGLAVTHRFSTKSWLSQTCQVCQKNMMFGVKCKHCRLKCHNKCTKESPSCRISFLPITKIRRTESVPSDINNPVDRPLEAPQFGTLPKAITKKDHPPVLNQLDSSSNPSSTTSSTPSSPAPFQNPPSATPPPNPSPKVHRENRFHFPAACYFQHRQQFIFPDVSSSTTLHSEALQDTVETEPADDMHAEMAEDEDGEEEEEEEEVEPEIDPDPVEEEEEDDDDEEDDDGSGMNGGSDGECDGDELDDLPSSRSGRWKGPISRKASQTSVYLQEWDIPFEQLDLGELIGKGRWGKVHKGRWHGEVAIRLLEIDGNNQDHLKLFKKEVMNYRQTRHENVVLFMGACMAPPHLAIITSFCKGRTLYSVVRDTKNTLDINKTRQIAQEIVKGMGYLHAKGIVHKDLKSKNVFHDTNKVIITDFGLFGISGVVQEGRRDNELKLPHGWICYLAPEIVRRMSPGNNEDRLPFSNAADVYAFGTIWYELQARDWPIINQPVEATIWQVGSGEGIKKVLAEINLGKEVTEILSACWAYDLRERPTFTQLADMLEKLPKLNRRLSHPGHFWKSAEL